VLSYLPALAPACARTCPCWYLPAFVPARARTRLCSYLPVLVPARARTRLCWYLLVLVPAPRSSHFPHSPSCLRAFPRMLSPPPLALVPACPRLSSPARSHPFALTGTSPALFLLLGLRPCLPAVRLCSPALHSRLSALRSCYVAVVLAPSRLCFSPSFVLGACLPRSHLRGLACVHSRSFTVICAGRPSFALVRAQLQVLCLL
jgi:hypothetical protein